MSTESITIERTYPVRIEKVWQAITESDKLKEWFFNLPDFRLEMGFEFIISDTSGKPKHRCCLNKIVPHKILAYSFANIQTEGISQVNCELFDEGDQTRLVLIHTGLETFPLDLPGYQRKDYEWGWTYLFGKALPGFLQ